MGPGAARTSCQISDILAKNNRPDQGQVSSRERGWEQPVGTETACGDGRAVRALASGWLVRRLQGLTHGRRRVKTFHVSCLNPAAF